LKIADIFILKYKTSKNVRFIVGYFEILDLLRLELFYLGCIGGNVWESLTLGEMF
jgi:hypothetical protein